MSFVPGKGGGGGGGCGGGERATSPFYYQQRQNDAERLSRKVEYMEDISINKNVLCRLARLHGTRRRHGIKAVMVKCVHLARSYSDHHVMLNGNYDRFAARCAMLGI